MLWLALWSYSKELPDSNLTWGLSERRLQVFCVHGLVFLWYYVFLSSSHVRVISDSKVAIGVSVSVHGCFPYLYLCLPCDGPVVCLGCTPPLTLWDQQNSWQFSGLILGFLVHMWKCPWALMVSVAPILKNGSMDTHTWTITVTMAGLIFNYR